MKVWPGWISIFWMVGLAWGQGELKADRLELRDGAVLEGRLMAETRGGWQFQSLDGSLQMIPLSAIRLIHFADSARARRFYGISTISEAEKSEVVLLPTEAFGEDLLAGMRDAQQTIHILTYNLSNWGTAPMADIFEVLKEKAQAGADVCMVLEFGSGTSARQKNLVLEFAEYLAGFGVEVLYLQEYKVQHKKLVIVDGETAWVGSANLTTSAMEQNEEFNARTTAINAVAAAEEDFGNLRGIAKPSGELRQ